MAKVRSATDFIDRSLAALQAGNTALRISPPILDFTRNSERPELSFPFLVLQCESEDYENDELFTTGTFSMEIVVQHGDPETIQEELRATIKQCVRELHKVKMFGLPYKINMITYGKGVDTQGRKNLTVYGAAVSMEVKYKEDYL